MRPGGPLKSGDDEDAFFEDIMQSTLENFDELSEVWNGKYER